MLQQYLPLAVLKQAPTRPPSRSPSSLLQQYLPLAVLKLVISPGTVSTRLVATVLTACGIETNHLIPTTLI